MRRHCCSRRTLPHFVFVFSLLPFHRLFMGNRRIWNEEEEQKKGNQIRLCAVWWAHLSKSLKKICVVVRYSRLWTCVARTDKMSETRNTESSSRNHQKMRHVTIKTLYHVQRKSYRKCVSVNMLKNVLPVNQMLSFDANVLVPKCSTHFLRLAVASKVCRSQSRYLCIHVVNLYTCAFSMGCQWRENAL